MWPWYYKSCEPSPLAKCVKACQYLKVSAISPINKELFAMSVSVLPAPMLSNQHRGVHPFMLDNADGRRCVSTRMCLL